MASAQKIRIAIDFRSQNYRQGIGSALLSLAHSLSLSNIADQEYTFLVDNDARDWLEPHAFGPCKVVSFDEPTHPPIIRLLGRITPLRTLWRAFNHRLRPVPASDRYVEKNGFDIVHFPTGSGYRTGLPSICQPWDLQHLHYPEFFTASELHRRGHVYPALCRQATCVCAATEWSRKDFVEKFLLPEEKVKVIPWGNVFDSYPAITPQLIEQTLAKYRLEPPFFFYPAGTWPHKNHAVILRALRLLKDEFKRVVTVCFTGAPHNFGSQVDRLAIDLGVSSQVHHLGFVSASELQALFRSATALVFPSKFEGFGLPILEAFHARLPVLCSNATVLPELARDAALYFDPSSESQLAALMIELLDHPAARKLLADRGLERLSYFSMAETARQFQQLYADIAAGRFGSDLAQSQNGTA